MYDLSQLGRTTKGVIELMDKFEKRGITFVSHTENIQTSSPTGRFLMQIIAAINELNRTITIEKVRSGLESARAIGRFGGKAQNA